MRANPVSFDDHYTQPRMFYVSLSPVEQQHLTEAFTFELSKCTVPAIRERMLGSLANVDPDLCAIVAAGLGLPAPKPTIEPADVTPSPALSQLPPGPGPIAGRVIGIVAGPGADLAGIGKLRKAIEAAGAIVRVVAPIGGSLRKGARSELIERTFLTTRSIEYVAGGSGGLTDVRLTGLVVNRRRGGRRRRRPRGRGCESRRPRGQGRRAGRSARRRRPRGPARRG